MVLGFDAGQQRRRLTNQEFYFDAHEDLIGLSLEMVKDLVSWIGSLKVGVGVIRFETLVGGLQCSGLKLSSLL